MNYHTATLSECCQWLAVAIEHRRLNSLGSKVTHEDYYRDVPPLKPTLDAIAAAMPEGWTWKVEAINGTRVVAKAWPPDGSFKRSQECDADIELLARARLDVACHMAEEKTR